jgi:D-arabinose 1-dehydrogenase-like Zn-dependent alcohol dehydrogenase
MRLLGVHVIGEHATELAHLGLLTIRAMIETYPLEKAAEGYARMMSGNAEFRVVLTM